MILPLTRRGLAIMTTGTAVRRHFIMINFAHRHPSTGGMTRLTTSRTGRMGRTFASGLNTIVTGNAWRSADSTVIE